MQVRRGCLAIGGRVAEVKGSGYTEIRRPRRGYTVPARNAALPRACVQVGRPCFRASLLPYLYPSCHPANSNSENAASSRCSNAVTTRCDFLVTNQSTMARSARNHFSRNPGEQFEKNGGVLAPRLR